MKDIEDQNFVLLSLFLAVHSKLVVRSGRYTCTVSSSGKHHSSTRSP
jgi:hypothetical protein